MNTKNELVKILHSRFFWTGTAIILLSAVFTTIDALFFMNLNGIRGTLNRFVYGFVSGNVILKLFAPIIAVFIAYRSIIGIRNGRKYLKRVGSILLSCLLSVLLSFIIIFLGCLIIDPSNSALDNKPLGFYGFFGLSPVSIYSCYIVYAFIFYSCYALLAMGIASCSKTPFFMFFAPFLVSNLSIYIPFLLPAESSKYIYPFVPLPYDIAVTKFPASTYLINFGEIILLAAMLLLAGYLRLKREERIKKRRDCLPC